MRTRKAALLQSITAVDVRKLAHKYLQPDGVRKVQTVNSKVETTASRQRVNCGGAAARL